MKLYISLACIACLLLSGCSQKAETKSETSRDTAASKTATPQEKVSAKKTVEPAPLTAAQKAVLKSAVAGFKTYLEQSNGLVSAIKAQEPADKVSGLASELTKTGVSLAPAVLVRFPACKAYLDAVVAAAATMHTLPLEEIESGYHKDGKLPKNTQGECYHAKDLVVHPATVVALAKGGLADRAAAQNEIAEVLTHLDQLRVSLKLGE